MLSTKAKIIGVVASVGVVGASAGVAIPLILKKNKKTDKFNFKSDLAKIQDLTSNKLKTNLNSAIGGKEVNQSVTSTELGIEVNLSKGVTAEYKINSVYNSETGIVKIDVILKKDKEKSAAKTITVTAKDMAFAADLSKIGTFFVSSKDKIALKALPLTVNAEKSAVDLGITEPSFSSGVTATYKVKIAYNNIEGKVTLTVTLKNATGASMTKDVVLIASDSSWAISLAKIVNALSIKDRNQLKNVSSLKTKDGITSSRDLGYSVPSGMSSKMSYKIKEPYNVATGKVVVEVSLTQNSQTITKDIVISARDAGFDYSDDLAKIVNAISSKAKVKLKSDTGSLTKNKFVTATQLGYTLPTLSSGISVTYKVEKIYESSTGKINVIATLSKNAEVSVTKEFTVIANDSKLGLNLAKYSDAISSSQSKSSLSSITKLKSVNSVVNASDLGISSISLDSGITATYRVKTAYDKNHSKVVVTVKLTDSTTSVFKDITIKASDA